MQVKYRKFWMVCTCGSHNFMVMFCPKCGVNQFVCCKCGESLDSEFSKEYVGIVANQYVKKYVML
jgi:hypothetical protein